MNINYFLQVYKILARHEGQEAIRIRQSKSQCVVFYKVKIFFLLREFKNPELTKTHVSYKICIPAIKYAIQIIKKNHNVSSTVSLYQVTILASA